MGRGWGRSKCDEWLAVVEEDPFGARGVQRCGEECGRVAEPA